MKLLSGLTIFFPFLNDEGTVERQIILAYTVGKRYAKEVEVIAIHGGFSNDMTKKKILQMQTFYPKLIILNKENNTEGYAVIKHGFNKASKEWIFYTDGDAQYHLEEDLIKLIEKQEKTKADIVNGYKVSRHDVRIRVILGAIYKFLSRKIFNLPIRDVDCDFRLIRKSALNKINLDSTDASILPELIIKLNMKQVKFAEVPVRHYPRVYGKSNYTAFGLMKEKIVGDFKLYLKIRRLKGKYLSKYSYSDSKGTRQS